VDRMVRHILVKVRKDQQQFEHAITLLRLRFVGAFFQILNCGQRIRKQPLETIFGERSTFTAACKGLIRAQKSFIQKMIEAELRAGERRRGRLGTPRPLAIGGTGGIHLAPLFPGSLLSRGW
jgi:hypothetical protein